MLRIHKALACLAISTAVWLAILGRPEVVGGARTAVLLVREGEKGGERGSTQQVLGVVCPCARARPRPAFCALWRRRRPREAAWSAPYARGRVHSCVSERKGRQGRRATTIGAFDFFFQPPRLSPPSSHALSLPRPPSPPWPPLARTPPPCWSSASCPSGTARRTRSRCKR